MLVKCSELLGKVKQQQTWVLLYNSFKNSNENMLIDYMKNERLNIYEFSHKFTMMRCPVVHSLKLIDTLRQVHSTVVC